MPRSLCRLFLSLIVLCFSGFAFGAPHKVRVSYPALAKLLIDRGGRQIADYGAFQLIETDDPTPALANPNRAEAADDFDVIELNSRRLNTRAPEVQAQRKIVGAFAGKKLHLVHFVGPIKSEWRAALEQNGVQIVHYIPENAYLVYGDAASLAKVQAWATSVNYVQWEGEFTGDLKIHSRARPVDERGNPRLIGTDTFTIQMIADADANPATLRLIDRLKLTEVISESDLLQYHNITVSLPAALLDDIAAQPDVVSIQPYFEPKKNDERQDQILAGNLSGNFPSGPGYLAWLASKGFSQTQFNASGFAVDMSDSGIDNGTTAPGHFGLYRTGNSSLASRVIYNRLEGRPNRPGSTLQGCDGHGTLNSHIVAGYDDLSGFPHVDAGGYHYGLGVCPFVKVGSSVIFDPDSFTRPNYSTLQSDAYNNGARISNNSWGADVAGAYNTDSQSYDKLVRDSQTSVAGNQQMVIVFAAGNAGPNAQTVDSPGSAKNVITVGAAENVRSMTPANGGNSAAGNDGCGIADSGADNANDIISFSGRGPCADGRMKPDIVAPGTHITGGVAQNSPPPSPSGTGSAISCFSATGVCGSSSSGGTGNANNFFPLSEQFYTVSSGTSHSTPAIAGACALIRQYFINNGMTPPTPAMTKAYLINSTRYLTGAAANDNLWSPNQGMGELNLGMAFDGVSRIMRDQVAADIVTGAGQTRTFTGVVADSIKPFRVTLAWTDAFGSTAGNAYNNNLDLTVTIGGNTYKGNVFNGQFSTTGGSADGKNNLESVFLPAGASGPFTVTITAANIVSDGIVNGGPTPEQDFALVIYNAAQNPNADVSISKTASSPVTNLNGNLTFTLVVTNMGPNVASNVVVSDVLPAGFDFVSATSSQGSSTNDGVVLTCALGLLTNKANALITVQAIASVAGSWTNIATVSSDTTDLVNTNNSASAAVTINSPPFISSFADATNNENQTIGPIPFTVGDSESPASSLILTATSSNTNLVPVENIVFSGSGSNRVLTINPATNQFGSATITVIVSDGMASASNSFAVTFNQVNLQPSLAAIPDKAIYETTMLVFTNLATDFDSPPQVIAFSLDSAPTNASIDAATGVFTWTPTEAQGPGTNVIIVRVTDNGTPSLSATQSFAVIVLESNLPPVLAPIADYTIHAGTTLIITNSASDPDIPTNVLTFSLDPIAPAGSAVDSLSGIFTWTPDETLANTITNIAVRVTDNGSPNLSDTKSFSVTVVSRPVIQSIAVSNNVVLISWSSISGQGYALQRTEDLSAGDWVNVTNITADGSSTSTEDPTTAADQEFYRVSVRP
jgi:uncharacterized repeat protein (TIGR01451 family)